MSLQDQVLDALKKVKYPGLSRDIVSFGFVHDLEVNQGDVSFVLRFQTENRAAAEQIAGDAEKVLREINDITSIRIGMDVAPRPNASAATGDGIMQALQNVKYKIAVASGKGGVGKSTVSTNLALALRMLGNTVGLLDADIYGPSQQMMLGIEGRPEIDEIDEKIIPMERHGVKTMSLGLITDADTPVIWRGPMVMKAIEQFLSDVKWGALDYLIIDLPPGTGDAQLTLTQRVPLSGAIVVTTPQDVALIDARKGLAMFRKVSVPVLGIIENMSYYICRHCGEREEIFGHGGGAKTAEMLSVPFLGEIPLDPKVVVGGDSGEPIVTLDPTSPAAEAFINLAAQVHETMLRIGEGGHNREEDHDHDHDHGHGHSHPHPHPH